MESKEKEEMKFGVNFEPMNQNILVKAPVISETTKGGVVKSKEMIAEEKKKADKFLEVVAVSEEITNIQIGDKILIGNGNLNIFELDGVDYAFVNRLSIVGRRRYNN